MRMLLKADEFGRMDGRLEIVLSSCFPGMTDVTTDELDGWLKELESCDPDGMGPIHRYESDGWPFIALVNWEKHRAKRNRAESSRFPDPPQRSAEFSGAPRNSASSVVSGSGGQGVTVKGSGSGGDQSAARRSSAAQADLGIDPEQNPESKPKRRRNPPCAKPKPSHRAIAIFCEEYKAARNASAVVAPQSKPKLGEIFADVGMDEERLRAALRIFFAFEDPWIEDSSYSASAFCSIATKCFTWAEKRASAPKRPDPSQPPEDDSDRLTRDDMKLLFGDKK